MSARQIPLVVGLLAVLAIAVSSPCAHAQEAARNKQNVLLIIADDLNTHVGCYGNQDARPGRRGIDPHRSCGLTAIHIPESERRP